MRKGICLSLMLALVLALSVFAEEPDAERNPIKRFAVSWSASFGGHPEAFSRTSILGLGITLYHSDQLHIRNQIEFCNGVMVMEALDTSYFKKVLANKLSIGVMTGDNTFRPYGFLEGRVGTCGEDLYDPWVNPLVWNLGLGAGLDIYATEHVSFFMEIAFLGNFYQSEFLPQQRFELGAMYHFWSIGR